MTFSLTLTLARLDTPLSMLRAARYCNVAYRTWASWEQGTRTPPLHTQTLILQRLKEHAS